MQHAEICPTDFLSWFVYFWAEIFVQQRRIVWKCNFLNTFLILGSFCNQWLVRCWYRTTHIWFMHHLCYANWWNWHTSSIYFWSHFFTLVPPLLQAEDKKKIFYKLIHRPFIFCWHSKTWSRNVVTAMQHFVHITECIHNQTVEVTTFSIFCC